MSSNNNKQAVADEDSKFPQSFICPLTQEVMREPVMDPEGNSFERSAIEEWLSKNSTSPITRTALNKSQLLPNRALKEAIEERRKELGLPELAPAALPATPSVAASAAAAVAAPTSGPVSDELVTMSVVARKSPESSLHDVLISIKPKEGTVRAPLDVVCVIDTSGSMSDEATVKSAEGTVEAFGLTLLDIVKHAMKTLISALGPQDRVGLVSFSSKARTEFGLTKVADDAARKKMMASVESLEASGSTNLWDGLFQGLEAVRKEKDSEGRLSAVLLLTDGCPNISPPRGEIPMLKRYKDQFGINCMLNTYGFGYSLNSVLLRDLAIEAGGTYSFIPDSSFVGTVFVHALSNLLATAAKNTTLSLEFSKGTRLVEKGLLGGHPSDLTSWGAQIQLSSLQFGQSKDVVVKLELPNNDESPFLTATLSYETRNSKKPFSIVASGSSRDGGLEVEIQRLRLTLVDTLREVLELGSTGKLNSARTLVDDLIKKFNASPAIKEPRVADMLVDLTGQVKEAISKEDFWKKWGVHYLPSLMRAHLLQQCNNFKDPGVQHYGGTLFSSSRDAVDDIFVKLPPPTPSIKAPVVSSASGSRSAAAAAVPRKPVNMKAFHYRGGGCFDGSCVATMADGSLKRVDQLKKGDLVRTSNGVSEVVCILKTVSFDGQAELVTLEGGVCLTPYHPVKLAGTWVFPCSVSKAELKECPAVYSFLLKNGSSMFINGTECVALAHGLEDNEVVKHPYFGTQSIVEDMKKMPGFSAGVVEISSVGCVVKDPVTGMVCQLVHPSSAAYVSAVSCASEVPSSLVSAQISLAKPEC